MTTSDPASAYYPKYSLSEEFLCSMLKVVECKIHRSLKHELFPFFRARTSPVHVLPCRRKS